MNRYLPLLLCAILGCASADGSFIAQPKAKVKSAAPSSVKLEPPHPDEPSVSLPENVSGKVGIPVLITATTNCKSVIWLDEDPTDDLWVAPGGMLNPEMFRYTTMIIASAPGEYRLKAIAAMGDVPVMSDWCILSIKGPQPPPGPGPGPGPIPPDPGPTPPPAPVQYSNLLIYTFEDALARTIPITNMLNDPFWLDLQAKGHKFEKFNTTNKAAMDAFKPQIDANGGLPCIVIMELSTRKWLNKDPADLKLPADSASLKSRIAKFTGNLP